ncbi:DUF192 domain-containing protein [Candidatus Micrarchaeota archaeon]|nr:DUF192 domain-containing protein [Candidatus Micrarchaeota archaeon]
MKRALLALLLVFLVSAVEIEGEWMKGSFQRMHGLMFRMAPETLFFEIYNGEMNIHSIFVFFPFYAIYLDGDGNVVEKKRVEPFRLGVVNKRPAKVLIEIGLEEGEKIKVGEKVVLVDRLEDT